MQKFYDGRDWFFEKRMGMFLHWGLYAIHAWHEQEQMRNRVSRHDYGSLLGQFNPIRFNPASWLDAVQKAGMEYLCLTAKHHDGFCLWDTAQTDFNIMHTPYKRDIVAMLAEECHKRDFPLCLYYSVVDWHHPNYRSTKQSHELKAAEPGDAPDMARYLAFLKAQLTELCTNYGAIHGIWWDINQTGIEDPSVNQIVRNLQPQAVINNRGFDAGDFGTPEREADASVNNNLPFDRPTEGCNSVHMESWGYRSEANYYTPRFLIQQADNLLAKGGNYLLNIGPRADGTLPETDLSIARAVGQWYQRTKEAFHRTVYTPELTENQNVLLTRKGDTLYVHLHQLPAGQYLSLKPITKRPVTALLLNDGRSVASTIDYAPSMYWEKENYLRLVQLPVEEFADTVMVLKLTFENEKEI